ncbi:serine hydrolase [Bacteroides sp. 214]|uniref:serine hydrolase domain-containing protein n=1 Tax=Bacteroides sp. 214 TaxID=2302935 RepID=UPI0013D652BD|nr:serine hydrolase domain-containing protein [Bacteroides sp. 214]
MGACTTTSADDLMVAETQKIAEEATLPLIQLEYVHKKHTLSFELSQIDSVPASANSSTVFQAASLSKPVFAYIVLRMLDKGSIDLDAPVATYTDVDRFENKEWAWRITPRMVLSHRTGLYNWAAGPSGDAWPTSKISFLYEPDSIFSYSGEAFAFLQRAVENIEGKSLQEIAEREVFVPFDMPNTSYGWKENYTLIAADGYNREGGNAGKYRYARESSAYTLRTSAKEYSRFIKNALIDGVGLKPETHRLMLTPTGVAQRNKIERPYDKQITWGLGIGIEHNEELGDIYHHWGDNGNFKALFVIAPKVEKYLVYFTNSRKGHDIIDELLPVYFHNTKPLTLSEWISNDDFGY